MDTKEKFVKELICTRCGGTMIFDEEKSLITCPYCDYAEKVETLEDKVKEAEEIEYAKQLARERAKRKAEGADHSTADVKSKPVLNFMSKFLTSTGVIIILAVILIIISAVYSAVKFLNREAYNPFESADVSFSGTDGEGELSIEIDDEHKYNVEFFADSNGALHEGQKIIIKAKSDSYKLTEKEKEFTVSGLNVRVQRKEQITPDVIEYLHAQSVSKQNKETGYDDIKVSYKPLCVYVIGGKDISTVLDVWTITYKADGKSSSYLWVVDYKQVFTSSGIAPVSFEDAYEVGSYKSVRSDSGHKCSFTGYDSTEQLEAAIYKDLSNADSVEKIDCKSK